MPWYLYVVNLIFLCICIFVDSVLLSTGITLPPVHWYSSNSVFKTSNNDHVIDVKITDDIDFFCPHYPNGTDPDTHEYYVIYRVSKESYDNCVVSEQDKMRLLIVNCSKPRDMQRVTLSIISFNPVPGKPEFHKGQTYYFITSTTTTSSHLSTNHSTTTVPLSLPTHPTTVTNTTSSTTSKHPKASSTPTSSPSTTTTSTTSRASVKWRSSTTTDPPRTTTKKYRDNDDSDHNESAPKTGSHVNSAISVYTVRTPQTLTYITFLCILTHRLLWLHSR